MLRVLLGSIFLFFVISHPSSNRPIQIDEVKPYVAEFIRIGKLFGIDGIESRTKSLEISFGEIEPNQLGLCYFYPGKIILNEKKWRGFPPESREEILFHELGHCALGYENHTETGIMRPAGVYHPEYYRGLYKYLINEFFLCESLDCVQIKWDENKYKPLNKEATLTKADILNNTHAVVRFTATWCGPCRALAPIFDEVAKEHPEVKTYVVDVDENPDLAQEFNVRGIPLCMSVRNKAVDQVLVGAQPKPELEKLFK